MVLEDPGQEALLVLHEALLGGDIAARVRLAELLLPAMRRRFANRRDLEHDEIDSIIGNCIATYLSAPDAYDRARAPLLAYLYRDIDGDVRNEVAKRSRRPEVAAEDEILELRAPRGNPTMEDEVVERLDPLDLPRSQVEAVLAQIKELSQEDREILRLRVEGVRSTHVYAQVLGIAHLPAGQQRREVKRVKDRLDKRLGSIRARFGE
jgi:DNA-directed RNA polymerase specialized sigma24 family protein